MVKICVIYMFPFLSVGTWKKWEEIAFFFIFLYFSLWLELILYIRILYNSGNIIITKILQLILFWIDTLLIFPHYQPLKHHKNTVKMYRKIMEKQTVSLKPKFQYSFLITQISFQIQWSKYCPKNAKKQLSLCFILFSFIRVNRKFYSRIFSKLRIIVLPLLKS